MTEQTVILGGGYVGQKLSERLEAPMTHRSREKCTGDNTILFDLEELSSWDNLPSSANMIWTFPAAPLELVQAFYQAKLTNVERLFVYASTSCYLTPQPDQSIDESCKLDLNKARVTGEEWLRRQGATILVLAGIYGPNRHPLDWLKKGLIKTPEKRVNLIHVDDIVAITECLLKDDRNLHGEHFNLADGQAMFWRDIAEHYGIDIQNAGNTKDSKIISNEKILKWLGNYRFRVLF